MAVKAGDFLIVNFTLKVKESGETVDTTYDAVAKDTHLHREDSTYGPRFIILGEGWLPKGLEDSLVGVDIGKQTTVELPPDKGYGTRDPTKMRLVPLRRFRDKGIDPTPGAQIEFDGRQATVRAVGAGRVQVDYNHPLAGRTLIYDVSIRSEEHTSELQSQSNLVCRLLLEKKKYLQTGLDQIDFTLWCLSAPHAPANTVLGMPRVAESKYNETDSAPAGHRIHLLCHRLRH